MGSWMPITDQWWIATAITGILTVLFLMVLPKWSTKISCDILEFCDASNLKDAARGVWTNVALVDALLLTVVVAMIQASPTDGQFKDAKDMANERATLQEIYIALCLSSLALILLSLFCCVVNLVYVEPLSKSASVKYFIANPNTFGVSVLELAAGSVMMMLALITWVFMVYGAPNGVLLVVLSILFIVVTLFYVIDKSQFDPTGKSSKSWEWMWTVRPKEEWPAFARVWILSSDKNMEDMFRRLGAAASDMERLEDIEAAQLSAGSPDAATGATAGIELPYTSGPGSRRTSATARALRRSEDLGTAPLV